MAEGFARFAELAREIDRVRVTDSARSQGMQASVAEMTQHADELEERLQAQKAALTRVAEVMHYRKPDLTPSIPAGDLDPPTSLTQIARAIDRADQAANLVKGRPDGTGGRMPGLSLSGSAGRVYLVAAIVVALIQFPKWNALLDNNLATPAPDFLTTMIVTPGIVFVVAFLILWFVTRGQSAARRGAGTRLGILLCFGVGPLALLVAFMLNLKNNLPK